MATPYAVIDAGGRHVRVSPGEIVRVDRLAKQPGTEVTFDNVLLLGGGDSLTIGTPRVDGAVVRATVIEELRDRKVLVFHKKRRKGYRKSRGHRQNYTVVKIEGIDGGSHGS
jgi:large subunit ribosomal protein L21